MTEPRGDADRHALQQLLMRRFGMAAGTYGLGLLLIWVTVAAGFYRASPAMALLCGGLVVLSQLGFFYLFYSRRNLHFKDPSLTGAQVLVALLWLTFFLSNLGSARGSLLVLYILVLLFAVFHLPPNIFFRYAVLAFLSFVGLHFWDYQRHSLERPEMALLQASVLLVTLIWMCLFVSYVHRLRQRMRQRHIALQAHQETLRGMMRQLEDLACTDELTGLFNRRHFLALAEVEVNRLRRGHQSGLALIDLDHFKRINDIHGHAIGDQVLQAFSAVARTCLRDGDILARYGGEEFVLLLPNTDAGQFGACCERLRDAFAKARLADTEIDPGHISLSVGMTLLDAGDTLDAALQRADEALYRAKDAGRNRCAATWQNAETFVRSG